MRQRLKTLRRYTMRENEEVEIRERTQVYYVHENDLNKRKSQILIFVLHVTYTVSA